ncbi:hypothetical protein KUTeg_000383 [Tegillarca granosa]|uniref:Uncharacterized protein n=1 Tax=Tegillarca granosa TaxID=220873 RepID=A0ABQ9G0T9_TEGGR|nr:hypothetical protein KUTeg_000383 [Tegillarca granosa]
MNEMQREVLKRHHMDLIRDIIVTEELLGECYQNGLFDTSVIDFIRVRYRAHSTRVCEPITNVDSQLKTQVEQFVQSQFCLSRKMSETDKHSVENFLCKQMQKLLQRQSALEMDKAVTKQWLLDMNNKLKAHVEEQEINKNQDSMDTSHTEETINMKSLERQINLLLNKLNKLDAQVSRCYELFHDSIRKTLLQNHIDDLMEKCEILCCEIKSQKKKEDEMSEEIYNLKMDMKTSEKKQQFKDIDLEVKSKQITSLQHDIKNYKGEIERLNVINRQHLEKEKTLDDLKNIIDDLKYSRENMKDENILLRQRLEVYEQGSPKTSPRRAGTSTRMSSSKNFKYSQRSPRRKASSSWKS